MKHEEHQQVSQSGTCARRSFSGAPFVAFVLLAVGWVGLGPWRPNLAGDDFGYYDSVVRTLTEGRMVVSEWLNPFSVGLTVPAGMMTAMTGDLWLGCMLTVGTFGFFGVWALRGLLIEQGFTSESATAASLLWALLPVWLGKWTRFESPVPATSLMIMGLWLLLRGTRTSGARLAADWPSLLGGAVVMAWAISIRQNHVVLVAFGGLLLLTAPGLDRRFLRLVLWSGVPLVAFLFLQFGLPKTYAQEHMLTWRLTQLTPAGYLANLMRGIAFSAGGAALLLGFSRPAMALEGFKRLRGWRLGCGVASVLGLVGGAFVVGRANWIAPFTDILLLQHLTPVTIALTLAGALLWPTFWPLESGNSLSRGSVLCLAAVGYITLTSLWGFWEYYFLESCLLVWCAGLASASRGQSHGEISSGKRILLTVVAIAVAGISWLVQLYSLDEQVERLKVFELAFRDGVMAPSESTGMHFGQMGWNLFPAHQEKWNRVRQGNPLAFGTERKPTVYFRWAEAATGRQDPGDTVLREGTTQVGLSLKHWTLFSRGGKSSAMEIANTPPHRRLPLSRAEWQEYLSTPARR